MEIDNKQLSRLIEGQRREIIEEIQSEEDPFWNKVYETMKTRWQTHRRMALPPGMTEHGFKAARYMLRTNYGAAEGALKYLVREIGLASLETMDQEAKKRRLQKSREEDLLAKTKVSPSTGLE